MIQYPWNFQSKNWNMVYELHKKQKIDYDSTSKDIYIPELMKIEFDKFILTFSDVYSTIREDIIIHYNEVILKLILQYKGQPYIYPYLTYVNNEFSLIRGFFLGFQKFFANINIARDSFFCNSEHGSIKADIRLGEHTSEYYPPSFILLRNYDFGDDISRKDIVSLNIKNYVLKQQRRMTTKITNGELLENVGLAFVLDKEAEGYYTEDEFVLYGVKKL